MLCAYIAALAWLGQAECVGTLQEGYMVMPLPHRIDSDRRFSPLTNRFSEALAGAADLHAEQARKGTTIPYIAHLLGVTSLALHHGADEDEAIAAVLHDAIEDAPDQLGAGWVRQWIQFRFGERVLRIVEGCTDADVSPKPPWRARKETYIAHITKDTDPSVILVSASDKLHNAAAILGDFRRIGDAVFERFNADAGKKGVIGYYRGLVEGISPTAIINCWWRNWIEPFWSWNAKRG